MPELSELSPTPSDFQTIRQIAHSTFGLELKSGKELLVAARLRKLLRELHLDTFEQYCRHVLHDPSGIALENMVDALTTNYTSFFRERQHFDFLRTAVLPALKHKPRIRCWSAAASTGEEPYTLAITLHEAGRGDSAEILATDISTRVLEAARQGIFNESKTRDIPPALLRKYLLRGEDKAKGWYLAKPELRNMIDFQRVNLVESFDQLGKFDLILCRNVMIYFDRKTQMDVVSRLSARLTPGGYLFIGHSESLSGFDGRLKYLSPAIYRNAK